MPLKIMLNKYCRENRDLGPPHPVGTVGKDFLSREEREGDVGCFLPGRTASAKVSN